MAWFQRATLVAVLLSSGSVGCGQGSSSPLAGQEETPSSELSGLEAVEVTTVTTVQGSSGIFLSPRPQQERPGYLKTSQEPSSGTNALPSADLDRAKVDTALLFRGSIADGSSFDVGILAAEPQHYFPAVQGTLWPITLGEVVPDAAGAAWSEWDGWRAYAARSVDNAPVATLDYELVAAPAPLVLSSEGDDELLVTNRSTESVAKALLVYSHAGGIGIRAVTDLGPGMRKVTSLGPKEAPPSTLLDEARAELEAFFAEAAGPDLARAMAQSKSIPLLETPGLRLVYLLADTLAPRVVALPEGFGAQRRIIIAQAEVLLPTEEQHVVSLLENGLTRAQVPVELGRFSRAKLELGVLSEDLAVQERAAELLETLPE